MPVPVRFAGECGHLPLCGSVDGLDRMRWVSQSQAESHSERTTRSRIARVVPVLGGHRRER